MGQKGREFKERRKYVRLNTQAQIRYTVIGKPGTIKVTSKNVSAGGICAIVSEQLAEDTPLQLEIDIPDLNEPIHALGRVVWQKKVEAAKNKSKTCFDTGIEFTGISDFDRFNINRYVLEHIELET